MLTPFHLKKRLVEAGLATRNQIRGCTSDDVALLERQAGGRLPQAYRDFLVAVGRGAGDFLRDVDIFYDSIADLNVEAADILNDWEDGQLLLPDRAFVFSMRQGEQFMFFCVDGDDNPPIDFYYEGRGSFQRIASSIWAVVESELQLAEKLRESEAD